MEFILSNHIITDIMLLRYPDLDVKDIARFRKILFPLRPNKFGAEKLLETEREAAEFFEELHTRSDSYLKSNLTFYKAHYGASLIIHPLDAEDALLSEEDLDYWCKADYWTLQDFAAILVGRKPDVLTQHQAGKEKDKNLSANEYLRLFELLKRSCELGKIRLKSSPSILLAWASDKKIRLSFPLVTAAIANNAFDEERELHKNSDVEEATHRSDGSLSSQQKAGLTKQKENLQKLVIVMAKDGYGFEPDAASSPIPMQLQNAMEDAGISMDVGTIRKHLKDAKQFLPSNQNWHSEKLVSS